MYTNWCATDSEYYWAWCCRGVSWADAKIYDILYKIGMRKTKLTFFQNRDNMSFCQEHGMIKGPVKLIPGSGVNLQYHAKQPYPAETEPVRFLFMGRIRREKGIDEFLAAAEKITKKYNNVEFHVVGGCEGDYESRLLDMQSKGIITYHGRQMDVRPFIAMAACTLHPSFYPEGMSNVLLESCSTGRPIMTTMRPGCREIVEDGCNGFLVKQQDAEDLIEKAAPTYLDADSAAVPVNSGGFVQYGSEVQITKKERQNHYLLI